MWPLRQVVSIRPGIAHLSVEFVCSHGVEKRAMVTAKSVQLTLADTGMKKLISCNNIQGKEAGPSRDTQPPKLLSPKPLEIRYHSAFSKVACAILI